MLVRLLLAGAAALPSVPAFAGTVRVEVVPELGAIGVPGVQSAPVAAPLQLSAGALAPALSAPALIPVLPSAFIAPKAAVLQPAALAPGAQAAVKPEALIKTLAAPALDLSKIGTGESSGAAEKDFMARAQLGAPVALAAGAVSAPSGELAPKRSFLSLLKPARRAAKPAEPAVLGALDSTGSMMKDALLRAAKAGGEPIVLGFTPTPKSLKVMAEEHKEHMLYRRRSDGVWLLHGGGDATSVGNSDEDWDIGLHNHPMLPGLSAYTARYPTPEDFRAAEGLDARVAVITPQGVVEWNPSLPKSFWSRLTSGWFARAATGVFMPYFYEGHVKRLGLGVADMPWRRVTQEWLERKTPAPLSPELLIDRVIPELVAEELPVIAAKLGVNLTAEHRADVLARTNGYRLYWHSATTYKDHPDNVGIPDGHFRKDFGIRLMVKPDWKSIPDTTLNYKPLFSHEYTHWLQSVGHVSYKYGGEAAAVAVEVLRAIELAGLDAVKAGRAATVHQGVYSGFETGREWARKGFVEETAPYRRGALAGAAYEASLAAGRPEAAWEFLNLVIAGKNALEPAAAWARVVGSK